MMLGKITPRRLDIEIKVVVGLKLVASYFNPTVSPFYI
jgi:hypothetical protein